MNARTLLSGTVALSTAVNLFTGCATRNDTVAQAEKTEENRPGIAETKAIAEKGFIYGLPLVMNYAANYEFWLDKTSDRYKCPMNQLFQKRHQTSFPDGTLVFITHRRRVVGVLGDRRHGHSICI